jgi:hypothetical protein
MTARLFGVCVTLALSIFMATGGALLAQPRGVPPCPPRERGAPKPEGCYDPCPRGMVGEAPNCSCPPGTQLAGRPTSPSERCVPVKSSPSISLERTKKIPCPKGQIGTGPFNCHCPPGLTGPDCNQPMVKP